MVPLYGNDALFGLDFSSQIDRNPVNVATPEAVSVEEQEQLRCLYEAQGFAFFRVAPERVSPHTMAGIAASLGLGSAFVPPYLKKFGIGVASSAGITVVGGSGDAIQSQYGAHNAFQTTDEQKIHCDGTVQPIGLIKTSLLLCKYPGASGGESTFFNSLGFFRYCTEHHPDLAEALLHPESLKRAVVSDLDHPYIGPAYAVIEGFLASRLSHDTVTDWSYGIARLPALEEIEALLTACAVPGSRFFYQTLMRPGEGVIMANTRISHGRTAYANGMPPREMLRGLYLHRL